VIANRTNPNTLTDGGVAEFEITDPVVALQGSGGADAPHLLFFLDTTNTTAVRVAFDIRDIDGSADNAVQAVALQYRVGTTGPFVNVENGNSYTPDATTGPSQATLVTPVAATLPGDAENQPQVEVRVITTNAAGNDEWVGIDNIVVSATAIVPTPTTPTTEPTTPTDVTVEPTAEATATSTATTATTAPTEPTVTASATATTTTNVCEQPAVRISEIQGSTNTSPRAGQTLTIQGILVGDFQEADGDQFNTDLDGFYLQEEQADQDANELTSEGIFVYALNAPNVVSGDVIRITGTVQEFNGLTQLVADIATLTDCGDAPLPAARQVLLPVDSVDEPVNGFERYEGMYVAFPQALRISEYFNFDRFGEIE
jgi:predicted extracellular nuclease